jgi:hypothetical protein
MKSRLHWPTGINQQVFTREKLEQWGKWCVEHLQDQGHFWCEDVIGGLLVVERR